MITRMNVNSDGTLRAWSGTGFRWADLDPVTFDPVHQGSDWCSTPTADDLQAFREDARVWTTERQVRQAHIDHIKARAEQVYLRLGPLPETGYSYNHRDRYREDGVSCYRAYRLRGKLYLDCTDGCAPDAWFFGGHPSWFFISGEEVGTGSDGEPVLRHARVLRRLRTQPEVRILWPLDSEADLFWKWAK